MYAYSPIKKLSVKNFRNIGEVVLDFSESPIISLVGENESGKTSIVKAFSVCALHATPREQKDFIRDGTGGFGVAIELEDGTLVIREKTTSLNRYAVRKPDGTIWEATKLENSVPLAVQSVMGLSEEPETKEYLQIRTYEDQLLFVVTPASTNYKVMYDALKVDQLTRAIKLGSKEVNSLKASIDNNDNGIQTLTNSLRSIRTYDITHLLKIKERLSKELKEIESLERASYLYDSIDSKRNQLGALAELSNSMVSTVNELEAIKLSSIKSNIDLLDSLSSEYNKILPVSDQEEIDIQYILKLSSVVDLQERLKSCLEQTGAYYDIGSVDSISEVEVALITSIISIDERLKAKRLELSSIEGELSSLSLIGQEDLDIVSKASKASSIVDYLGSAYNALSQYDTYVKGVEDYLKSIGAAVEICPNCGESIIIDVGII